jgi:hypothetical protein
MRFLIFLWRLLNAPVTVPFFGCVVAVLLAIVYLISLAYLQFHPIVCHPLRGH